jgi:hypothetical protein
MRRCYRLYPVDYRFPMAHLTGSIPSANKELAKDTEDLDYGIPATVTHRPGAQYESQWAQTLERNGKIFQTLIKDCLDNHSTCTPPSTSVLPSMLLQISGTVTSPSVRLAKVADIAVRPLDYACLSYCWGGPQPGMTTVDRVASYIEEMDTATFPATVLDAIRVTLSLSMEYLWVDAYCIEQDSALNKVVELNKMASIYAGATCTICAMSARAATEGFLESSGRTNLGGITTWNVSIHGARSDQAAVMEARSNLSEQSIQDEPLLTRAWTFQEALLSLRLIMFFSEGQQPALRCSKSTIRSDGGVILQYPQPLMCVENTVVRLSSILGNNMMYPKIGWEPSYELSEEWSRIVKQYSQRSVTFPEDTLPALMGIANLWETRLRLGTYCAGLWSATLKCDLIWRVPQWLSPRKAHTSFIAPSWSWASRAHSVYYQFRGEMADDYWLSRVVACDVVPIDPEAPNGAIRSAKLTLECITEEVSIADFKNDATDSNIIGNLRTSDGSIHFVFDDEPRPQGLNKIWILSIAKECPYNNSHEIGLGVAEVEDTSRHDAKNYVRVGMFYDRKREPYGKIPEGPVRRFTII